MTRQRPITLMALGTCLLWSGAVMGQTTNAPSHGAARISAADRKFVLSAARGGIAEVELGQLASKNGANDAVKQFGQRMVEDHGKANDELKQLAATKGIALPSSLDRTHKKTYSHMSRLTGQSFDHAYAADMVKDHQKDVREFEKEAASGTDPDIKAWAAKTLPTLQEHLRMAQGLPGASAR